MFKKLFTINYNGKKFLILVDENHRKTFLQVSDDGKLLYPTIEDFSALHRIYNERDPFISYATKYKFIEKVVDKGVLKLLRNTLIGTLIGTTTGLSIGSALFPTANGVYNIGYESSQAYYSSAVLNQAKKTDVIVSINNNPNFDDRIKEVAIQLLDDMLESDPDMDLTIYNENMKKYGVEWLSEEEMAEKQGLYVTGCCDANRKMISLVEGVDDSTIAHELAHAAHNAHNMVGVQTIIIYEDTGSFLAEAMTDKIAGISYGYDGSYYMEKLVLDYFLYNTDNFNFSTYNKKGVKALIDELKEKYPNVDIDYLIDFFQTNMVTEVSSGECINLSEEEDALDELFKIAIANINIDKPYESFKEFMKLTMNNLEVVSRYIDRYNEALEKKIGKSPYMLQEESMYALKNVKWLEIVGDNIYVGCDEGHIDYDGNIVEDPNTYYGVYIGDKVIDAALDNRCVYSEEFINNILLEHILYNKSLNFLKCIDERSQLVVLNRVFEAFMNSSNNYNDLYTLYEEFNKVLFEMDIYDFYPIFFGRFKEEVTKKCDLSENDYSQLKLKEAQFGVISSAGIVAKDGKYYLSNNRLYDEFFSKTYSKYNDDYGKATIVSPTTVRIECIDENGVSTLELPAGVSNYYYLTSSARKKMIEYFEGFNGDKELNQENIKAFAESLGIIGEITYDNAFTLSDGNKVYGGALTDSIMLQVGKDSNGNLAYSLKDGKNILYQHGVIGGNSTTMPYKTYLMACSGGSDSHLDELLSDASIGGTFMQLNAINPTILVRNEYLGEEQGWVTKIDFVEPLVVVVDSNETYARNIRIIEADFNGNIYACFIDGSRMLINDYLKGKVMDDEPYYAYFDECLANSGIEPGSDGKYHLTREDVVQIAANHINETALVDMQK